MINDQITSLTKTTDHILPTASTGLSDAVSAKPLAVTRIKQTI